MDSAGLPRFTADDILFIQEYCRVFSFFATVLDIFQREKNSFIGMVLPLLTSLKNQLTETIPILEICGPSSQSLIDGIDRRFKDDFENEYYYKGPGNALYVVGRNFFLVLLRFSAWPGLGPA